MMDELKKLKRENRELKKWLANFVKYTELIIGFIDAEMSKPSTPERGRRIARVLNELEMFKDSCRFGPLGIDFRTGKKRKAVK